jgi:hypothetical protein
VDNQCVLRALAFFTCALALNAQAPGQKQVAGLETDWDIAVTLQEISAHANRLLPMLEKIDVYSWVEKGASDTYLSQLQSSKVQARALAEGAKLLAGSPQRLSASLELFFRMNGLDTMLTSLQEGIRRYQSPREAQALASLEAEGDASRDRFQRYIVNLAAEREQDLQVMDHEAQRCRGVLTQAAPKSGRKK